MYVVAKEQLERERGRGGEREREGGKESTIYKGEEYYFFSKSAMRYNNFQ